MELACPHHARLSLAIKGTVQQDFRPPVFFINRTHLDPWLKYIRFWLKFRRNLSLKKLTPQGIRPREVKTNFALEVFEKRKM